MCLFSFQKPFCDFPAVFFFRLFLEYGKREERWERKVRVRCMVCKVLKHRTVLFTKNKESSYIQMLPSEIVKFIYGV